MDGRDASVLEDDRPRALPWTVRATGWLLVVVVVLLAVTALLTWLQRDDLVLAWAETSESASAVVAEGGLEALEESSIAVPAFVPVALASLVVFGLLAAVLGGFLRDGVGWSRGWLTALAGFGAAVSVLSLAEGAPALFVVLAVLAVVVDVALVAVLWHPATTRHLRG